MLPNDDAVPTIPDVITPDSANDYLEVITRAVFQAGVSWSQIAAKWGAYRRAFERFDPQRVAGYTEVDVERILAEPGILRMPRKVRATIANAAALLEIVRAFGSFHDYAGSFPSYAATAKDMKKRFSFMGDMNVWYVLFRTGESVPRFDEWVRTIPNDHPRMREMVDLARAAGTSREQPP